MDIRTPEQKEKERKEYIEETRKQLFRESFLTDDGSDEHTELIKSLVNVLEQYEPSDREAIEKERKKFMKNYEKENKKEIIRDKAKFYGKQTIAAIIVAIGIVFAGNIFTQATVHKSLADVMFKKNPNVSEYQLSEKYTDITFESISGIEQFLNKKLILPKDTLGMEPTSLSINRNAEDEYKIYITYNTVDGKYLLFHIIPVQTMNIHLNTFNTNEGWEEIELPELKLSDVTVGMNEDNFKMYTYIDQSLYEIESDLPKETLVNILNTIPLP